MLTQPPFEPGWKAGQLAQSTAAAEAWLAAQGVQFTAPETFRELARGLEQNGAPGADSPMAEVLSVELLRHVDLSLAQAGEARRIFRRVERDGPRPWYLLTPDEQQRAVAQGHPLVSPQVQRRNVLLRGASVPVALATWFIAGRLVRDSGASETVALVAALVAWGLFRFGINRLFKT